MGSGVGIEYVPNTTVKGIAVDATNVYIAGDFRRVDNVDVPFVAKWDGQQWSPVGRAEDISPNGVTGLALSGSMLYACGDFYTPNRLGLIYLARLQGDRWLPLGSGVDYYVHRLVASGGRLYVLGQFHSAGGLPAAGFAWWDGAQWTVPAPDTNSGFRVNAIATSGEETLLGEVVSADPFTVLASRITRLSGTNRVPIVQTGGAVWALAQLGSNLFCSGGFEFNGGVRTGNLAQWDGAGWSRLSHGVSEAVYGPVSAVSIRGNDVYAAGSFTQAGDTSVSFIAHWNGTAWSNVAGGLNGPVSALALSSNALYVAGAFTSAGGVAVSNVACWDGANWRPVGEGLNGSLAGMVVNEGGLHVAGALQLVGRTQAVNIVRWTGSNWTAVADGIGAGDPQGYGYIGAFAGIGTDLYVAGDFTKAGDISATNIARWNGTHWEAVGGGITGDESWMPNWFGMVYVSALAASGNTLYVGGSFTHAGGVAAANIAKWDGTNWSALGSGLGGQGDFFMGYVYRPVLALAANGSEVYAGGEFGLGEGAPANWLARWDGWNWSALGAGLDGAVGALACDGNRLCVAGNFGRAGGRPASGFGLWTEPLQLRIMREGAGLTLSWPGWASNAVLQAATRLNPSDWVRSPESVQHAQGRYWATNVSQADSRFFRLQSH